MLLCCCSLKLCILHQIVTDVHVLLVEWIHVGSRLLDVVPHKVNVPAQLTELSTASFTVRESCTHHTVLLPVHDSIRVRCKKYFPTVCGCFPFCRCARPILGNHSAMGIYRNGSDLSVRRCSFFGATTDGCSELYLLPCISPRSNNRSGTYLAILSWGISAAKIFMWRCALLQPRR